MTNNITIWKTKHTEILLNREVGILTQRINDFFNGKELRDIQDQTSLIYCSEQCNHLIYDTRLARPILHTDFQYLLDVLKEMHQNCHLDKVICTQPNSPLTFYVLLEFKAALEGIVSLEIWQSYSDLYAYLVKHSHLVKSENM